MATSSYTTGMSRALHEGAITVYGGRNGEAFKGGSLLPPEAFAPLPSLYHAVMTKAPGDFACLMIAAGAREAAEASRYANHRARVHTIGRRPHHPRMLPNFGLTPSLHSNDILRIEELEAKMRASTIDAIRSGVRHHNGTLLFDADALQQLKLSVEKGGRGNEAATAQDITFLSEEEVPFLLRQHIGALHEIPEDKLGGPFGLIYLSTRARITDLIGIPKTQAEGKTRRKKCAERLTGLLPEGGLLLGLNGFDDRLRQEMAERMGADDVYLRSSHADLLIRGGTEFAKEMKEATKGRGRPAHVFDAREMLLKQRKKSNT